MIHKTAIIGNNVQVGKNVSIGAHALIEDNVEIGDNVTIKNHGVLRSHSKIQNGCLIDSFAVIGGDPQDVSFDLKKISGVLIGKNTTIREHVTVHRSTIENSNTMVGNGCFLMACSHVGHDCIVEDSVILANCALLGGFVKVGQNCFIGGGAALHQFVRVGEGVILGGYAASSLDLPPFTMGAGLSRVVGLNLVGLKRGGSSREAICELKQCLSHIYGTEGKYSDIAGGLLNSGKFTSEEATKFLKFFMETSRKGIAPLRKNRKLGPACGGRC